MKDQQVSVVEPTLSQSHVLPTGKPVVEYKTDTRQETIPEILERTSRHGNNGMAFMAIDLGEPIRRIRRWRRLLPNVEPFYAIKCNSDIAILKTLVEQGIGFDCASKEEISTMLKLGVEPEKIIFANPCKPAAHIQYAARNGVDMMTFDNMDELYKVKENHPGAKLVLRVLTDDSKSVCRFGLKFGAPGYMTKRLLQTAKELDIDVIGVSFHVGSGCFDPTSYHDAIAVARKVFDEAAEVGYKLHFLDLGGGYPGLDGVDGAPFEQSAAVIRQSLADMFPEGVRFIAEPGRYVVAASNTLAVSITSRRAILPHYKNPNGSNTEEKPSFMYYVNDGVYGSFNCILFDHAKVQPKVLQKEGECLLGEEPNFPEQFDASIWGPTCDSMDCITRTAVLPELNVGDWLYFENMGAYTVAASSTFNGFPKPILYYTNTEM